ncbi:sensor domain-containing protein [Kitasatospora sp. NBC_01250]|uniref:sensor domain-containing protein n=1 Tax=unclassified Kitasatospora TaxID=2633591 RepID=UPI002E164061|nr:MULTISPECIES: sensor domain-containing protein [unclassified Kitasatospora]WSJ68584.1 sensor domain-containing protein [Kitasatospora sp. NBC_01302]
MTTTAAPFASFDAAAGPDDAAERRHDDAFEVPYFWRGPFARETYRELGYILTSLFTAIIGFAWTVPMFAVGAGTAMTFLGLPLLALLLAGARALGALERARVAGQLGLRLRAPRAVRPAGGGAWSVVTRQLRDPAGWKAVLHHVVMFPWHVFCFVLSVTLWAVGLAMALLPAYNWVFPAYTSWPGLRLFTYSVHGVQHDYYLSHLWQVAGVSLVGILLIFLTARLTHLLTNVSRGAAWLLLRG